MRSRTSSFSSNALKIFLVALLVIGLALVPPNALLAEGVIPPGTAPSTTPGNEPETETITVSKEEAEFLQTFLDLQGLLREYHTRELTYPELYEGAIRGMVDALGDRYSQHFTEEELASWEAELEGEYGGLGITLDLVDSRITVINTFPNTPAQAAGLKAGDILLAVGEHGMIGKLPVDAAVLLRGEPGTTVEATFLRPSTGETLTLTFTRELITPPTMDIEDLGDGLWLVSISSFTENVGKNLPIVLRSMRDTGSLRGIVLDLRDNPGGLLDSCVAIANELVPQGPVVELRRQELKEPIENPNDILPVAVAVLVNGGSASASEILAGAIRDRGVGVLVGETTFGKGSVQSLIGVPQDMGGVKFTIAEYFTPSGYGLNGKGLAPDFEVKREAVQIPTGPVYKRPLRRGVVGLDVLAVQECLSFLGYNVGEPDGVFGSLTDAAISAFAKEHELSYSGTVTEEHITLLGPSCVQKVKDLGDTVLGKGIEILKMKIETGNWRF